MYAIVAGGTQVLRSIGLLGRLTPDEARAKAKAILANPAAPAESESFAQVLDQYLAHKGRTLRIGSYKEIERHLRSHASALHRLPLAAISRRDIAATLGEHPGVVRNRIRSSLSAMFKWAIQEGMLERNPVEGTGKIAEASRERVLSEDELRSVWLACDDSEFGRITRLLILTGQRRDEIADLRWNEVNLADAR